MHHLNDHRLTAALAAVAFSTLFACGGSSGAPAAQETTPATTSETTSETQTSEAEVEAAPATETTPAETTQAPPAPVRWGAEALAALEASLPTLIAEDRGEDGAIAVTRLDVSDLGERTFAAYLAVVSADITETALLAIAFPGSRGPRVEVFELGETELSPGMEDVTAVDSHVAFRLEGGVLRFTVRTQHSYAEAATDGECQQRSQSETTATTRDVFCTGVESCAVIPTAVELVTPGYEQNCRGRRSARPAETTTYRVSVTPSEGRLRIERVGGTPPEGLVGDHAVADLGIGVGEALTLITDE